jgi:hypothetical protein
MYYDRHLLMEEWKVAKQEEDCKASSISPCCSGAILTINIVQGLPLR